MMMQLQCALVSQRPDPVQLILYQNGIVMFDGPFRSYEEQSTAVCIADLVDGYFPTELQTRYPDGVPFKVLLLASMSAIFLSGKHF